MTAAALPVVGLMLLSQARQQTARRVRHQMLQGRRLTPLESMSLEAMERGAAGDMRQCRDLLRLTVAANDEAPASPVQALAMGRDTRLRHAAIAVLASISAALAVVGAGVALYAAAQIVG